VANFSIFVSIPGGRRPRSSSPIRNSGAPSSVVAVVVVVVFDVDDGGEGEGADGTDDDPILAMMIFLGARVTNDREEGV
jgi:hypothetical protein